MSTLYTNKIAHNTASNNSVTISGSNFIIQGTLYTSGSITASGDISSSGTITANNYNNIQKFFLYFTFRCRYRTCKCSISNKRIW